jgi:hypothetical protein
MSDELRAAAEELRKWWRFTDSQQPMSSWHDREDFIERVLPTLLTQHPADDDFDGLSRFDIVRLMAWLLDSRRQPPHIAFTSGELRETADQLWLVLELKEDGDA